jgi:hypothetical protein
MHEGKVIEKSENETKMGILVAGKDLLLAENGLMLGKPWLINNYP